MNCLKIVNKFKTLDINLCKFLWTYSKKIIYKCVDNNENIIIENNECSQIYALSEYDTIESLLNGNNYNFVVLHYKDKFNEEDWAKIAGKNRDNRNLENEFNSFDSSIIEQKLREQLSWLKKRSDFINFNYTVCITKYTLFTHDNSIDQYYKESNFVYLNKENIAQFFQVKNIFDASKLFKVVNKRIQSSLYKDLIINGKILIKAEVIADIVNYYILSFYSSNIYEKKSLITPNDLQKIVCSTKISIKTIPFSGIYFDGEGQICSQRDLIKCGKLMRLIGNNKYDDLLHVDGYGYADLNNYNELSHQRLSFKVNDFSYPPYDEQTTIVSIEHICYDMIHYKISAKIHYIQNSKMFECNIIFNVRDFMSKLLDIGDQRSWHNNVYCSDLLLDI